MSYKRTLSGPGEINKNKKCVCAFIYSYRTDFLCPGLGNHSFSTFVSELHSAFGRSDLQCVTIHTMGAAALHFMSFTCFHVY